MQNRRVVSVLAALAIWFSCPPAWAQRAYQPPLTNERDIETYVVKSDGSFVQTLERVLRVETPQGIEDAGAQQIKHISSQESIESVEAWTLQPDGTRIPVLPASIHTRDEDNSGGASKFSDTKVTAIIFPKVQVGSRVSYRVHSHIHTAPYPGEFNTSFVFSASVRFLHLEIRISLPAERKLYIEQRGVSGGLQQTTDGISHYAFHYSRNTVVPPETAGVGVADYADYLRVSTMPDMVAIGASYQKTAKPKAEVTEAIRALAIKLTADKTDERAKVKALYHWVAGNIRYVSVSLGNGRLVPHAANDVLSNLYGDCKDHVVLLEALLDSIGVPSSPALVSSGRTYSIPLIGAHGPINHVINYVPSLDLYLDSTDPFAPFGTLPYTVMDKPVVLTALGRMGRTPRTQAEDHVTRVNVSMKMHTDGSIEGSSSTTMSGIAENSSRSARFEGKSTPEEEVVKEILFRFNETGSGSIDHTDPEALDEPYWVKAKFRLDAVSNVPGRGALTVPVGLAPGQIPWTGTNKPLSQRLTPFPCRSFWVEENYTIEFPPNVKLESIPSGAKYNDGAVAYRSIYRKSGQAVSVSRQLILRRDSHVCAPQENELWNAFYKVLQRDLRAQIFYR